VRVYISADIEGVTGTVSWGQAGGPRAAHYDWDFARRMMTHDVNAAIRGARAAGADYVLVKDSHGGSKNLLIDQLEPGVELISGHGTGRDGMMEGIDSSFDCAMLVGYHGMAGTLAGIMEHTISGMVHRYSINGMAAGEIAMSTATAGQYGVPLVFVSSDVAGCAEAADLIPGLTTVAVKEGLGRYMGRLRHPSVTGPEIEAAVKAACASTSVMAWVPESPVTVRVEHNRGEEADAAGMLPGWIRVDAYTVEATCADWAEAHVMSRRAMANAGMGAGAND
jgi:D-amino peptidase